MKATIIKASEIKPGDRALLGGAVYHVDAVRPYTSEDRRPVVSLTSREGCRMDVYDIGVIARIDEDESEVKVETVLPEPVEERERWLVSHRDIYGKTSNSFKTEQSARDFIKQQLAAKPHYNMHGIKIRHIRETVISVEKVQP